MRINLSTVNYRRIGYILAIGTVAAVAARVSYSHIRDVTLEAGQPIDVATVLPLAVDGMLLAATLAMAEDKANGRLPRGWARFGFWFGAVISVACNVASTIVHITDEWLPLAVFIAALAPVLLLITVEIMARPGKLAQAEADSTAPAKLRSPKDRIEQARKRAGYYDMNASDKAAWTKRYNERTNRTAPTSPAGPVAGEVPTVAELDAITA
jgi:hypothetical protein